MNAFNRVEEIVRNCDTAYLDEHWTWDTDPHQIAAELLAEHRTEVLAEAKVETVAWLVKKANEGTPVGELASKVDRGAVRIFLGTGHFRDAMDEHRAEVRRADAARLLSERRPHISRAIFCDGIAHAAGLLEQWADERPEVATATTATATPTFFQPGHVYAHSVYRFRCQHLAAHPVTGLTSAWGWFGKDDIWRHHSFGERQFQTREWTDVTRAGAS